MKYFSEFTFGVEPSDIENQLSQYLNEIPEEISDERLALIFSLLDFTSLSEKDNAETIGHLCDQVNLIPESYPDLPSPAAICVYPELVAIVKAKLDNPLVNIASVGGGFPASQTFMEVKLKEIEMAVEAGADEIDSVLSIGKFQLGLVEEIHEEISRIKNLLGPLHLKVIIETSAFNDLSEIRKASLLCMDAGADFIKTSTGKTGEGANPVSFAVMCEAVKDFYSKTGRKVGIKPAGGISDASSANVYVTIVEKILGTEWLNPEKFRIGASRLANDLIRRILKKDDTFSYFY
ncbi:MAG: deoxyribose-phosphate aldolase [Bacteroidales bacterium]|nr:deoxyribose-phosphate aldolase [Bacteroidales bacterium]